MVESKFGTVLPLYRTIPLVGGPKDGQTLRVHGTLPETYEFYLPYGSSGEAEEGWDIIRTAVYQLNAGNPFRYEYVQNA